MIQYNTTPLVCLWKHTLDKQGKIDDDSDDEVGTNEGVAVVFRKLRIAEARRGDEAQLEA